MPSHDRRSDAMAHPPGDGALEQLLETERALAERVADAAREADRVGEAAGREIERLDAAFEGELASELAALRTRECADCEAATEDAMARARRDAARFDHVGDARIDALADRVLETLLGPGPAADGKDRA
jgi:hypothetical protein